MVRSLLISALILLCPMTAKADYYVWQDPASGLSMSFPDTWKTVGDIDKADVITIVGPSDNNANPRCVVKVKDDKRFVIFPVQYGPDVQKEAVSRPFWEMYLGEYSDYTLNEVYNDSGLGRWHASYALAGYMKQDGTVLERRRAIMFASLYFDKMYIVECSSLDHAYDQWHFPFMSIIKSIDFKKMYNELPTGHYRDFQKKAEKYFWSQTSPDGTTGY